MKKTLGRLGATISAVALLAGGLVGVATPAVADGPDGEYFSCSGTKKKIEDRDPEVVRAEVLADTKAKCPNWEGYFTMDSDSFGSPSVIGYGHLKDGQSLEDSLVVVPDPPLVCEPPKVANEAGDECVVDPDPSPDPDSSGAGSILTAPRAGMRWVEGPVCGDRPGPDWESVEVSPACVTRDSTDAWARAVPIEGEQEFTPPPPCWSGEAGNNCPVGGALQMAAPEYAMVGVPVTLYAYASWRPDANSPAQPTNGTAVIRVDGEDYSGVKFVDGVAEWRFIPETEGMKEFTASGVVSSGISGANAYIDSVPARTYVLEYDPAAYAAALKKKRVEVGDTYVITDPNQARSYAEDRYEWSVSEKSDDVCAVYETKKGAVKAKFTDSGKCTVIWLDKESEESGKYTFIAKK